MGTAQITNNCQITISASLLQKFGLKDGDQLTVDETKGIIYLCNHNSGMRAYGEIAEAFRGAAAEAGFATEEEMQEYMKEIRKEEHPFRRTGHAKGLIHLPDGFDEHFDDMNQEIADMFYGGEA